MDKKHFPETIASERITLKKHSVDLASLMFSYVDQDRARLLEFLPWVKLTNTVQDEVDFIKMSLNQWERHEGYGYGIFLNSDGTYIGNVGVHSISWTGDRLEIGYWILGKFEGQGYMSEATKALTNEAFAAGFNRVEIHCDPANQRSASVPRRLGFLFEAQLKEHTVDHQGKPRDTLIFARLKSDGPVLETNNRTNVDKRDGFIISTDKHCLQVERIHRFLSRDAYWSAGIPFQVVERAIKNSLCFGIFDGSKSDRPQVGFARVLSDHATFAWLCDVYIELDYRGRGLSKWLIETVMNHSELRGLRRICLATKDAHSLYEKYGFEVTRTPGNWLEIKDNDIYKRQS